MESRQKDSQLRELTATSASLKGELESSRASHEEYKSKAKKVLQEKENLIEALRTAEPGTAGEATAAGSSGFEEAELQQAL